MAASTAEGVAIEEGDASPTGLFIVSWSSPGVCETGTLVALYTCTLVVSPLSPEGSASESFEAVLVSRRLERVRSRMMVMTATAPVANMR